MKLKNHLFNACENHLTERITRLNKAINELETDLGNETKSSAGDKYETSREMINAEINKLSGQLQNFRQLQAILEMAQQRPSSKTVQLGSLVNTSAANYLLTIPAGEIILENEKFYAIGINSPIGKAMLGKKAGEIVNFNETEMTIKAIF